METSRRKALYIFLSCILGFLLFSMFHRALFVIYEIIGNFYPTISWLHLPFKVIATIDFSTFVLALFIGGWYGIWIGLKWYKLIYEDRGVTTWFHGFVPHHWRTHRPHSVHERKDNSGLDFINSVAAKSKGKAVPKRIVASTARSDSFRNFRTESPMPWDSEESSTESKPAKKRVVRKTVRKVAKKKATE